MWLVSALSSKFVPLLLLIMIDRFCCQGRGLICLTPPRERLCWLAEPKNDSSLKNENEIISSPALL